MSESKSNTVVEKLILFAVFLVFAGIVVAFAFKWNYVGEDTSSHVPNPDSGAPLPTDRRHL